MIAVDIDGTIAGGGVNGLLDYLRERLRLPLLDVPADLTWAGVEELPEIREFREENPRKYRRVRNQAMGSLLVLRASTPMPGAVEALCKLSEREEVQYATIRGNDTASSVTTRRWLQVSGFPNSEEVVFCRSFFDKLLSVMRYQGNHVLIDDRYEQVADVLFQIARQAKREERAARMIDGAKRRLTIVAFGAESIPARLSKLEVRFVALPSWQAWSSVLSEITEQEVQYV